MPRSPTLEVRPLAGLEDAEWSARVMTESEPWITLRRGYEESLRIVTDPLREVHLAWRHDRRVGFVILSLTGPFAGYLQTLCVAPEARGQGLGTRLVSFVEEHVFRSHPNVFLCVSSFNRDAQRLYERLGYEVVGTLRSYLVAGHDEVFMRKTRGPIVGYAAPGADREGG